MVCFIILLCCTLIVTLVLKNRYPSSKLQMLTHVLIYLIEIISVTTFLNFLIEKYGILDSSGSRLDILRNYVFTYTVYQLVLLVTFKLKDSLDIDAYTSIKNEIDRCQLWAEFDEKIPIEYIHEINGILDKPGVVYNRKQREYLFNLVRMFQKYNNDKIGAKEFRLYLKQESLQVDYAIKIKSFGWMNSLLLRAIKSTN